MRGKGIGYKLYKKVMQYAYDRGILAVKWMVLDWNQPAIDFYKKTGAILYKDWYIVLMEKEGLEKIVTEN